MIRSEDQHRKIISSNDLKRFLTNLNCYNYLSRESVIALWEKTTPTEILKWTKHFITLRIHVKSLNNGD